MSPLMCAGIQEMVRMKHLKTLQDSRDNSSSCGSDIDRQELIDNYGSEKYLSKWNLDDENDGGGTTTQQSNDHKQSENELHQLTIDDDAASLVSYNSVRDAETPVKDTASYLPYQIQPTVQHVTLWQGYSGNIYFDPLRCQPMRINSSKPHMQKPKNSKNYRKTKSCSPSIEVSTANHYISSSAGSFHSLGSLRFASRDEKRKNTSCISHHGKLHKRFSDGKGTEPISFTSHDHHHHHQRVRCESAPESLVISGGHLKDVPSDHIDHVFQHNTKSRLTSKSKSNLPSLVAGYNHDNEEGSDKTDSELESTNPPPSKHVTDPKPVFIIPFGALDDPVEGYNNSNATTSNNANNNGNSIKATGEANSKRNTNKKKTKSNAAVLSNNVHAKGYNEPELALCVRMPSAERENLDETSSMQQVGMARDASTTVRREISDSSLSNYLRAVPTHLSKHKKMIPKLSYTKRTMDMVPGPMSMTSIPDSDLRISSTTALYGGYLPSTRATDTQLFRAEPSSSTQTSRSMDEQRLSDNKPRKRNKNIPASKHCQDKEKCHLPVIGWHVS